MTAKSAESAARTRYAIVGVGARSSMFQEAIFRAYRAQAELVAICDTNPGRLAYAQTQARQAEAAEPRAYGAEAFDRMISETRPHAVIVTSVDATHDDYIVRALEAGCDVITEKPMTTTPAKARQILDACHRAKKHIRVAFNYRYSPPRAQVKELLASGAIGDVLSVEFAWMLNTSHGADYFRRWHSAKGNSGGLLVHKATHHFDLVNWWLADSPETVTAQGDRVFYTPATARRMGLSGPHKRCKDCPERAACAFYFDLAGNPRMNALYGENEHFDGYFRDLCVWREDIDIEDTLSVAVRYQRGARLAYSLNAFSAWEGYRIAFNGTEGRLEHEMVELNYAPDDDGPSMHIVEGPTTTRLYPLRGPARDIEIWSAEGGHGGGDPPLLRDLFAPDSQPDPHGRAADERAGAYAMLVGAAANLSIATGRTVRIIDLIDSVDAPYPAPNGGPAAMPPRDDWKP